MSPAPWGGSCNKEPWGRAPPPMFSRSTLVICLAFAGLLLADYLFFGFSASLFLARKFTALVEYLAIWR